MRKLLLAPALAIAVALGAPSLAMAASNHQNGLVNVNLQSLALAIPVSVAVPVGVAANVCDISVLSLKEQTGDMTCTATNNSTALSRAVALAMTDPNGRSARNNQSGLVNVNVQDLALAVPVSVAVPIGIAAIVCERALAEGADRTHDVRRDEHVERAQQRDRSRPRRRLASQPIPLINGPRRRGHIPSSEGYAIPRTSPVARRSRR